MSESIIALNAEKASILLLAGFLGAGKTTLLKRILAWETDLSDTVVLVNEFGDVGIDGSLLKNSGSDVVELTSGCICCTLSADLKQSLTRIMATFKPARIFIESSGVADPTAIADVIHKTELTDEMVLSKVITVLDADLWEAREMFGRLFYHQLEMAHLILLNKIDLVEKTAIPEFLKQLHDLLPDTQVVPTIHCNIDPDILWIAKKSKTDGLKPMHLFQAPSTGRPQPPHITDPGHNHSEQAEHHDHVSADAAGFVTFSYQTSRTLDEALFLKFLKALPWEVFRMKGPVQFQDRTVMVNFVGGKSEWSVWDGEPETHLAFIGWYVSADETLNKLKFCVMETPHEPA